MTTAKQRLAFVVPNFITCVGLSLGISAIFLCFHGDFWNAGWLLAACVIVDKLDGTMARLLNAGSPIGVELDSLSDFVTFCVSPGILVSTALTAPGGPLNTTYWAVVAYASSLVYAIAGAVRLAKFNCLEHSGEGLKRNFQGIPTTMCGGLVSSLMLVAIKYDLMATVGPYLPAFLVLCGMAMVSRIYLPKLGRRKMRWLNLFTAANMGIMPALIILRTLPEYLFAMAVIYIVVGVIAANRKGYEVT